MVDDSQLAKVVILDDDPQQAALFCAALKRVLPQTSIVTHVVDDEFVTACVSDGSASLLAEMPSLVLLDCYLDGFRAEDLLPNLRRQLPKSCGIVIFTGTEPEAVAAAACAAGADDCIAKPMSLAEAESVAVRLRPFLPIQIETGRIARE